MEWISIKQELETLRNTSVEEDEDEEEEVQEVNLTDISVEKINIIWYNDNVGVESPATHSFEFTHLGVYIENRICTGGTLWKDLFRL